MQERVFMRSYLVQASVIAFELMAFASSAMAGTLQPDPANGKPATANTTWDGKYWTVTLDPNPLSYLPPNVGSPWLLPALMTNNQPFNNLANTVWKFSYAPQFNGTITMTNYAAVAGRGVGGANISVTYQPGANDPAAADVRWIQVIDTNTPTGFISKQGVDSTGTNGIPAGTKAYLDNEQFKNVPPGKSDDPWYGHLSVPKGGDITQSALANSKGFRDSARLALKDGLSWQAAFFIVKDNVQIKDQVTTHDVTIYGGVEWGFKDSAVPAAMPEPGTISLVFLGGLLTIMMQRRSIRRVVAAG
jgi:hypothetical protein